MPVKNSLRNYGLSSHKDNFIHRSMLVENDTITFNSSLSEQESSHLECRDYSDILCDADMRESCNNIIMGKRLIEYCPKSCNACIPRTKKILSKCNDKSPYFCSFLLSTDQCNDTIFEKPVSEHCPSFCGTCDSSASTTDWKPILQYSGIGLVGFIFLAIIIKCTIKCVNKKRICIQPLEVEGSKDIEIKRDQEKIEINLDKDKTKIDIPFEKITHIEDIEDIEDSQDIENLPNSLDESINSLLFRISSSVSIERTQSLLTLINDNMSSKGLIMPQEITQVPRSQQITESSNYESSQVSDLNDSNIEEFETQRVSHIKDNENELSRILEEA